MKPHFPTFSRVCRNESWNEKKKKESLENHPESSVRPSLSFSSCAFQPFIKGQHVIEQFEVNFWHLKKKKKKEIYNVSSVHLIQLAHFIHPSDANLWTQHSSGCWTIPYFFPSSSPSWAAERSSSFTSDKISNSQPCQFCQSRLVWRRAAAADPLLFFYPQGNCSKAALKFFFKWDA